ncbi:hypothetical protein LINPERPRIM_LOCUS13081 [Linum perenne]
MTVAQLHVLRLRWLLWVWSWSRMQGIGGCAFSLIL